jgi:ketosteroid isomerase-like protein
MKKFLIACAIFIPVVLSAQSTEEKEVADAVEQLRVAMVNADKTTLENLAAAKLSYGHSSGAVDDKKTFVEKITSGASDFVSIDLTEQTISISGKVAIVRHTLKAKTNDAGKAPGEVNIKVLLIWQKNKKNGWKLLARQAVKA